MIDRESTFSDPKIVRLLKTRFVPVAIDQAYQRRQQDAEGEFYRTIAGQAHRDFRGTTQGFYIATADGRMMLYNNNRDPAKLHRLMRQALTEFATIRVPADLAEIDARGADPRHDRKPPRGGRVVRVRGKVLDGYEPTTNRWRRIFQNAVSRDNLWISKDEQQSLVRGKLPKSLQTRLARFHLVDATRGEPPMWRENEVRELDLTLEDGRLAGRVHLETSNGDRGYDAELLGFIDIKNNKVVRFDVVALGSFWGQGRFTRGAPKGRFPLAISFTLADGTDIADHVPPQGARGWLAGYMDQ